MKKKREKSLTELADAAFREAAQTVVERAERAGTPIIICKNGKVVELDPKQARAMLRSRRRAQP